MTNEKTALQETLLQRQEHYGLYGTTARCSQWIKDYMHGEHNWHKMSSTQKESLDLIATKIARILTGDPNHEDSWRDISGYAELIVKELNGEDL